MYQYHFKLFFSFIFLIAFSTSIFAKAERFRCMWRVDDPAHTMVIGWDQVSGNNPVVYYDVADHGENADAYRYIHEADRSVDAKGMNNTFARLEGLQPNTLYYFVVKDTQGTSKRYSFMTLPDDPNARLAIIAGGDSRNHRKARVSANVIVSKLRPHFVMFGGDMTGKDVSHEWKNWFNDWQKTISKDGRITPIVVTRGNHEYSNKSLVDLFDVATKDLYYGLTFGGGLLRLYTLNSLIASGGEQKGWLEQDLRSSQDVKWKMAQYHFATRPHTKNKAERNDQLLNWSTLFHKYKVNLVVESDAHTVKSTYPIRPSREDGSDEGFIRDDENGTVYVGEGCWGAPIRPNNDTKNWTRDSGSFNQYKWIFLDQDKIEVRTIKTDGGDRVGEVPGEHVFTPPAGLNIWQASNGDVITVFDNNPARSRTVAQTSSQPQQVQIMARGEMEMLDFTAAVQNRAVLVSWSARNEVPNMYYEVQRSLDGKTYVTIEKVAGNAPNGQETSYLVNDSAMSGELEEGLSYRIKRVLTNGSAKIFAPSMVGADLINWETYSKIAPEMDGTIKVKYSTDKQADVSIRLLSAKNKRELKNSVYKSQDAGNYLKSIDMKGMPKGTYLIVVTSGRKMIRKYQLNNN